MAEDTKNGLGLLFGVFLIVLIGVVLLSPVAEKVDEVTNTQDETNESITFGLINSSGTQIFQDGVLSMDPSSVSTIINYTNGSKTTITTNCNVTNWNGTISCVGGTGNMKIGIDYEWQGSDYINDSASSRTIIKLIPLFFVLALLAAGIGYAWKVMKDNELI